MRLINADELPWMMPGIGEIPVLTKEEIDNMLKVDAIPIDWIKQWVEDDDSAMKFYIHLMILSWRMRETEYERFK